MFSISDLPETVALFPLPNAVLLPTGQLPLNIFEPRYLAMINHALKTDHRLIGMVQPRHNAQDEDLHKLHKIGCAGRITSFSETKDNRYLVSLSGICRFRVDTVQDNFSPYLMASVLWEDFGKDLMPAQPDPTFDRVQFLTLLKGYFSAMDLSTDWEDLESAEENMLINSLAMLCPFTSEEKQALLEAPNLKIRRETISTIMEFSLRSNGSDKNKFQ